MEKLQVIAHRMPVDSVREFERESSFKKNFLSD